MKRIESSAQVPLTQNSNFFLIDVVIDSLATTTAFVFYLIHLVQARTELEQVKQVHSSPPALTSDCAHFKPSSRVSAITGIIQHTQQALVDANKQFEDITLFVFR